jgi:flagellar biosynthesis/type III secretory pathway protein FliH
VCRRSNPASGNETPYAGRVTKRQIVEAREEAKRLLTRAEQEATAILQTAEATARQMREDAYREGYETALTEWHALLLAARERRDQALVTAEQDLLRLAVKIAAKIVGREIKRERTTIVDIVANALRQARGNEMVTVRVNPADIRLERAGREHFLDIVADPHVGAGGCIIESESGAIDAQLETQFRVLERALLSRKSNE